MEFLYCFEVYLPLVYNDGRMIEPEKFERIKEEILTQFGGITMTSLFGNPIYDGFWTEPETGHVHQDKNAIFTVLTPQTEESRHFFLDKKAEWASQLAQKELLVIVQEVQAL